MQKRLKKSREESLVTFRDDVIKGLSDTPKSLKSKYFYDAIGDELFQKIMRCPEYYPTNCEFEILSKKSKDIIDFCLRGNRAMDVVELGPGDASKSIFLLKELAERNKLSRYFPIDISTNIISYLEKKLPGEIKDIKVIGLAGEYFKMLSNLKSDSSTPKLVLFLGSSIGNMNYQNGTLFLLQLKELLNPGDMVFIGFDLMKASDIILKAYNDQDGYTKAFNLNLLTRINRELEGTFEIAQFGHFPSYNPGTGICRSHLISLTPQTVEVAGRTFHFEEKETMAMEISQKFSIKMVHQMAEESDFTLLADFYDNKFWFLDTLWQVIKN